jgi:hypothetical protein
MKAALAILAGFGVTLAVFGSGVVVATAFLAAEPVQARMNADQTDLWTSQPKVVDVAGQSLQRLPPREVETKSDGLDQPETAEAFPAVDTTVTAAVDDGDGAAPDPLALAHMDWCASRYRSYDPDRDTYNSYSGRARVCVSPYSRELASASESPAYGSAAASEPDADVLLVSSDDQYYATDARAEACASRYRSYRASDNTYQPYGGGPRRQCGLE